MENKTFELTGEEMRYWRLDVEAPENKGAEAIGVTVEEYREYESGRKLPTQKQMKQFLESFDLPKKCFYKGARNESLE